MGRRKGDKELDEITKYLLSQGAYSIKKSKNSPDKIILKALKKHEEKVYRFWLGVLYALVLMVSLYWLPLFGPMIAGYIGGKRAGSPAKGTMVGLAVIAVFYIIKSPSALLNMPIAISTARDSLISAVVAYLPWLQPTTSFLVSYTTPTITLLSGKIAYTPQSYTVLMVFAYIGGTMAKQKREEIRLMALSRIFSGLPVQPVLQPLPHYAPQFSSAYSGPEFESMNRLSRRPDREFERIYHDEYEEPERPSRKRRTTAKNKKSARDSRKVKKDEILRNMAKKSASRRGLL